MSGTAGDAFSRAWTDAFGSAYLTLEGGTGNAHVLVVARLEDARDALTTLGRFSGFKGRVTLCTLEAMRATFVAHAIDTLEPTGVIAVEAVSGIATGGDALRLEGGEFTAPTGATYTEPDEVAAWQSRLEFPDAQRTPSLASSLASARGLPALACAAAHLERALSLVFTALTQRTA